MDLGLAEEKERNDFIWVCFVGRVKDIGVKGKEELRMVFRLVVWLEMDVF